jgi:hypothetical protein
MSELAQLRKAVDDVLAMCEGGGYIQAATVRAALTPARDAQPSLRGVSSTGSWLAEVQRQARAPREQATA